MQLSFFERVKTIQVTPQLKLPTPPMIDAVVDGAILDLDRGDVLRVQYDVIVRKPDFDEGKFKPIVRKDDWTGQVVGVGNPKAAFICDVFHESTVRVVNIEKAADILARFEDRVDRDEIGPRDDEGDVA